MHTQEAQHGSGNAIGSCSGEQSVKTDEVYAGSLRGDARSKQTWGVFCDDCVELACVERANSLAGHPGCVLTGPGMERVIEHSRTVWAARAGV
jgi:hypothetical protein